MVDVILLIRLPRVLGGCGYIALSGDDWDCVHLDELMPTKGLPADMQILCGMPMSKVFEQSLTHDDDDTDKLAPEESHEMDQLVDTALLTKMSMQKAIIQLNDKADNSHRAQKRVEILHDLLHANFDVPINFLKVLERRVVQILTAREKEKTTNWVIDQAEKKKSFVVEGTSFRHVLWIQMEDAVASAMAQVFAVVDGDNNLDHVTTGQQPEKTDLWMKIFQNQDLLSIPVLPKLSYSVLSTSNAKEATVSCRFPFSWEVKARFDQIWRQVHNLPGISSMSKLETIQKCEELLKFPWLYGIKSTHSLFKMYAEDLVRMSMPECPSKVNQTISVSLVELSKNVYKDLTQAEPNDVSLVWLHVTYEGMRDNHQIFRKLSEQCGDMINTGDVKEATEAMHLLLEKLQPSNDLLKSYASCQDWLNKVKSVSTSVELIVSEDSLVRQHGTRGEELIQNIRRLWHSTQVVYLLMDNLLQDETQMEEKLLGIITKNFIHFSKRILKKDMDMAQTFTEVTRVLKQCNTNACKTYLTIDCASCGNEFSDPVELPCGHIFCKSCIDVIKDKNCFTCSQHFGSSYKQCAPRKREAMLQMNKFRSHCNSFFVEFILKCCIKENTEIPEGVVNQLLDFVRGNPKGKDAPTRKMTELSLFHEFMDPSPAVQSLVLRILLTSRMDQMAPHLQKYIEAAVKSNQKNTDEFYFMVVRCTEDQIQASAHKALTAKAIECLNMDFSSFETSDSEVTFDLLHNIAKIRFAVSVAADVIGVLVQTQDKVEDETDLLFWKLQEVVTKNPWARIFLLRNLCNKFDLKIIENVQCNEKLSWVVPEGLRATMDETDCTDKFLAYGAKYTDVVNTYNLKEKATEDSSLVFSVCAALAAVRQILHDKERTSLIKQVEMVSKQNKKWQNLSAVCKSVMQGGLSKVSKELCLSHNSSLTPVILHTVIVVKQSTAPEMNFLNTLCSQPRKLKKSFIPTMPDTQQEMEGLKTPSSTETFWECQCGVPVLIENCGRPWVIALCPYCKRMIGGEIHKPVHGFTKLQMSADDHMGYILGDASNRIYAGCERDLSGASLCLVRALIHSCLLWGAIDNHKATADLIAGSAGDVGRFLSDHLQKDIELLGKALGKNTENAEIAVHMFLRYIIESASVDCNIDFCTTETREKRNQWENMMQSRTRAFFKDFEKNLSEVHNNILKWSETNPLVNILYNDVPKMEDLSTVGPFNCPLMWRYEQKMSIQLLTHLIEQDNSSKKYPMLLDLVRKHGHIKNIRHLPQILSLQQKLMHHFRYVDSSEWEDLTFEEFLTTAPQGDVQFFQESTSVLMNIWANLKDAAGDLDVPAHLKEKEKSSLMISDLLPLENPQTLMLIVTHYLAKMQNDCINTARIQQSKMIESENLKPSHMITCDLEEDFLPIAISNIGYVVNEDGTETIDYNFKTLEKQLISRFISEKPPINLSTLPMMERNPVKTLQSFFSNVKDKLEPLSVQDKNYIMNEMRFINEISAALSTLKIAIGFLELSLSISSPDMLLVTYMKNELRMEDRSRHLQLPVLRTCQIKHIQSLWEVLYTRRSTLLTEMNQEPFYMIKPAFHESFNEEQKNNVNSALARIRNLDLFIIELHDVIMNIDTKGIKPIWEIRGTFETFLLYEKLQG
ncbi:E3 ubiquitin-protein ligase rnf213-alpha-like [Colossoma macropomum]|uniref:E3 ubiquitin-protein ligase rnf213-alpha-like n=1 Tax=Colossoma macropomum TaxID=42526 RepID=UPI0018645E3E|nr:E3 ubiquitin-protein ligase rnf213-alpha-like [Colossoma macropomum]